MATRFTLVNTGTAALSPTVDAGWEQTGQLERFPLVRQGQSIAAVTLADGSAKTVPITTTQDIVGYQFVSDPLRPQTITGTFSLVVRVFENANTNNVTLAVVVRAVSPDGGTVRGTVFSNFNQDTEFALSGAAATRIVNAQTVTSTTVQSGDRLVIEVGGHAAAPTAAGSYTIRLGNSGASDFALTSALTTNLNPWCEFSQDLFTESLANYQAVRCQSTGILSVGDRIR